MRPRHRTHQGWIDEVAFSTEISKKMKRLLLAVAEATFINKARNEYGITQAELARRLDVDLSNVKRATWEALDLGWLVLCQAGHKGHQQVFHRSVPWDPPRRWSKRPCERCGGHLTVRRAVLVRRIEEESGHIVDPETGEILNVDDLSIGVRNAPLYRTPDRTPYVRTTSAPDRARDYHEVADEIAAAIRGAA